MIGEIVLHALAFIGTAAASYCIIKDSYFED